MAGQKHKKKLAATDLANTTTVTRAAVGVGGAVSGGVSGGVGGGVGVGGGQALFCELCNVSCSGQEVMRTHVSGARHKKVSYDTQSVCVTTARTVTVCHCYDTQSVCHC